LVVRYRILGPLHVMHDGAPVDIGPPKQRAVLAALLLAAGRVVSVDRLVESVWGDDALASANANLQVYISNLRRALRFAGAAQLPSPITRQPPGYFLSLDTEDVDLAVFTKRCADAAGAIEAIQWHEALEAADEALGLWRGPLLEDMSDEPWVLADAARAEELRTDCRDSRIAALLALGRVAPALAEVSLLRAADPLSDRGCWLHMVALFRAGRASDALDAYTRHARTLDAELGLEPGAELRDLQLAVLRQAPELTAWPRPPEWTGGAVIVTPAASPAPQPATVALPPRGVLIGRERELSVVSDVLAAVRTGAVRWLILTGPPGIGKTRLAEEVAARVVADGGEVAWVACPDELTTPAWWCVRQLVRALGDEPGDVFDVAGEADADTARFVVYERIQKLLQAPRRLRAVVVDDAQWSDQASANCLTYLAGALRDGPLVFVVTLREGEQPVEVAKLVSTVARGGRNHQLSVNPLSTADVAALARAIADDPVTDGETATLAARTGGNPFFVSEYARLPHAERLRGELPSGVKAVLDRRLAALAAPVLKTVRAAAVLGDVIDGLTMELLASSMDTDIDTLADHFDAASDARIFVSSHATGGYGFAHGLLREHLVAGMPAMRRRRLHIKLAELLAESDDDESETRRARHLLAAQPLVAASMVIEACRVAAEQAARRWNWETAAQWWRSALGAYDRQPASARDDAERDELVVSMLEAYTRAGQGQAVLDATQHHLADALRVGRTATVGRLAGALLRTSGSWPWLAQGQDSGELLNLLDQAAQVADADPVAGARVAAALAVARCYDPDPGVSARLLQRADELAADSDAVADVLMGKLITYSGVATASREIIAWTTQLTSLTHRTAREDTVTARLVASMALMNLGDVADCEAQLDAAIAVSEELRLPLLRAQLRWMEANLAVWHGDLPAAERHLGIAARTYEQTELYRAGVAKGATLNVLRERGVTFTAAAPDTAGNNWGSDIAALVATVLLSMREGPQTADDARAHLAQWRDAPEHRRHVWFTLGRLALLAHLAADHGASEFVEPLLVELAPFEDGIAMIGLTGLAGPVALAMARLHCVGGDRDRARQLLAKAEALAIRTDGAPSALRCALLACELEDPSPQRSVRARQVADAAEHLGMVGVAKRAAALF
jgi:DNA-binding SARP family transcriptional activator/DNA polymerase III delta prime subunit